MTTTTIQNGGTVTHGTGAGDYAIIATESYDNAATIALVFGAAITPFGPGTTASSIGVTADAVENSPSARYRFVVGIIAF